MAENRIFRFDFSGDVPKILPVPEQPTRKKQTVSPEKRAAINEGLQREKETLTPRERRFCELYVKLGNGSQAVIQAGYNTANSVSASVYANGLLKKHKIKKEIERITAAQSQIMDAQEVMIRLSAIARGEDKDQFGLDISADTRMKALVEIAKRTVDIDNKIKAAQQGGDNAITIKLDWSPNIPNVDTQTDTDDVDDAGDDEDE